MTTVQLLIGALTLVTNAFYVGAEFALVSVRRSQIEPEALKCNRRARTTIWALEHLSAMTATAQRGITVSSLVLGAVAEPAIAHLLEPPFAAIGAPEALIHPIAFVIALTVATYLHMLISEMAPKNIALAARADRAVPRPSSRFSTLRSLRVIAGIHGSSATVSERATAAIYPLSNQATTHPLMDYDGQSAVSAGRNESR